MTTNEMRERNPLAVRWGAAVADRRILLGITQVQLAELCEVEQQTISKIENGRAIPRDDLKLTLARSLGTQPWVLFTWPEQPATPSRPKVAARG